MADVPKANPAFWRGFQREQAMNEDIDLSIWRAPMESAIYRAARSIGQLASKEAVDY